MLNLLLALALAVQPVSAALVEGPKTPEVPQLPPAAAATSLPAPLMLPDIQVAAPGAEASVPKEAAVPLAALPAAAAAQAEIAAQAQSPRASAEQAQAGGAEMFVQGPRMSRWKKAAITAAVVVGLGGAAAVAYHFYSPALRPVKPPTNVVDVQKGAFDMRPDPTATLTITADGKTTLSARGVRTAALSEDGKAAVTIGADGSWRLWDLQFSRASKPGRYPGKAVAASFADGGRTLVLLDADGTVRLYDLTTEKAKTISPKSPFGVIDQHAFSPNGERVSIVTKSDKVVIVDAASGKSTAFQPDGSVLALAETKAGTIVLASAAGKLKVWDIAPGQDPKARMEKTVVGAELNASAVSADGSIVVAGGSFFGSQGVVAVTVATQKASLLSAQTLSLGKAKIVSVAVDAAGERVVVAASDGRVWAWVPGDDEVRQLGTAGPGSSVGISADGKSAFSVDPAGAVTVWPLGP